LNKFLSLLLTLFLTHLAYARENFEVSYRVLQNYAKSRAILNDYANFMNQIQKEQSLHVKLEKVNQYINAIVPKYDDISTNLDYWATRLEFLTSGGGDCEDYVAAKYQTLLDLGVDENLMGFCIVKDTYSGYMHMVLGVNESDIFILDNLSFKILPYHKRSDLEFYGCFTKGRNFAIKNAKWQSNPPKIFKDKFENLIRRIAQEKIWKD